MVAVIVLGRLAGSVDCGVGLGWVYRLWFSVCHLYLHCCCCWVLVRRLWLIVLLCILCYGFVVCFDLLGFLYWLVY